VGPATLPGLGEAPLPGLGLAALQSVMLAAWTKAQVDFAAPMLWDWQVQSSERALLASASVGLLACALWAAHLVVGRSLEQRRCERWLFALGLAQSVCWAAAGGLLAFSSHFPPWRCHTASQCRVDTVVNTVGAWAWFVAGVLMVISALGWLKWSRSLEGAILALWSLSFSGLLVGTIFAEVPAADKWTYLSSCVWGILGCVCWIYIMMRGGALLK